MTPAGEAEVLLKVVDAVIAAWASNSFRELEAAVIDARRVRDLVLAGRRDRRRRPELKAVG